jgi:ubiquitin carboxyl-terminal hydrolase 5/13
VNCGRQQFGGLGGNGHALQHFQDTGHALGVKLGTITPEGGGDIYCYSCDDAKLDPELAFHLSTFGVNMLSQSKTEKSMTELVSSRTEQDELTTSNSSTTSSSTSR